MADKILSLSQEDAEALRVLIRNARQNPRPPARYRETQELGQSPECYVIKTPVGGIPGMVLNFPSRAECNVYREDLSTGELVAIDGKQILVRNLCSAAADGQAFGLAHKDKWGRWYLGPVCIPTPDFGTGTGTIGESCGACEPAPFYMCLDFASVLMNGSYGDLAAGLLDWFNAGIILTHTAPCTWSADFYGNLEGDGFEPKPYHVFVALYYQGMITNLWTLFITINGYYPDGTPFTSGVEWSWSNDVWNCESIHTESGSGTPTNGLTPLIAVADSPSVQPGACSPGTGTDVEPSGETVWIDTFTEGSTVLLDDHTPDVSPGGAGYTTTGGSWSVLDTENVAFTGEPFASFTFDPGLTGSVTMQFDFEVNGTAEDDNFSITWVTPNGLQFSLTKTASIDTWLLSVSDTGDSDTIGVTIQDSQQYTVIITCTPSLVSIFVNSTTAQIVPAAGDLSNSEITFAATFTSSGTIRLDNLTVTG